jgi:hypothetical protein
MKSNMWQPGAFLCVVFLYDAMGFFFHVDWTARKMTASKRGKMQMMVKGGGRGEDCKTYFESNLIETEQGNLMNQFRDCKSHRSRDKTYAAYVN